MATVTEEITLTMTIDSKGINPNHIKRLLEEAEDLARKDATCTAAILSFALESYLKKAEDK